MEQGTRAQAVRNDPGKTSRTLGLESKGDDDTWLDFVYISKVEVGAFGRMWVTKERKRRVKVSFKIPRPGHLVEQLPVTNWKSRGEAGLRKERTLKLHFGYIKFEMPIGDLSRDAKQVVRFKPGTQGRAPGQSSKSGSH